LPKTPKTRSSNSNSGVEHFSISAKITATHRTQAVTAPQHKDRRKVTSVTNLPVPQQILQAPATQFKPLPCASLPNYIAQDEDDNQAPMRQSTRSAANSIMQEAMLACVDIYQPHYIVSADLGIMNYTKTPKLTGTTYTVTPKQIAQRTPHEVAMQNGKFSDGSK
jgi:hypothetical protein